MGATLASAVVALASGLTTEDQMAAWGWRVPFLVGGLLAPLSVAAALYLTPDTNGHTGTRDERRGLISGAASIGEGVGGNGPAWTVLVAEARRLALMVACVAGSACNYYFKVGLRCLTIPHRSGVNVWWCWWCRLWWSSLLWWRWLRL